MSTPVEQIKERLNIADVVSGYLQLTKAGSSLRAKCPFHNEKTPSFYVSPARGSFYCFGCNKGGDMFTFVQEFEGLDFVGALRVLAGRAGVELTRVDPKVRSVYARLYLCLEKATRFFEAELEKSSEARAYLSTRGLSLQTIKEWRVGFVPHEWRLLFDFLLKEGFKPEEMEKVGLIKKASPREGAVTDSSVGNRFYDTFRGRVMFPIRDGASRVVAFSGRILPSFDDGKTGKYINSPETILFNKSETLYGFDRAKLAIRQKDATILVEGQMDLLMVHQAGYTNAVAVSGTALTLRHLERLRRLSENLILSFDADPAGIKASERAIRLALQKGFTVKVISIAGGKDPAELIVTDKPGWDTAVATAKHVVDFLTDTLLSSGTSSREQALVAERNILPFIALLSSPVLQSHFIKTLADTLNLREEALWQSLQKIPLPKSDDASVQPPPTLRPERAAARRIMSLLLFIRLKSEWEASAKELEERMVKITDRESFERQLNSLRKDTDALLHEAEMLYGEERPVEREVEELLANFEEEYLSKAFEEKILALGETEKKGNREETTRLLNECKTISERLATLKAARHQK